MKPKKLIKPRILGITETYVCLYCGQEIEGQYEEYEKYYECNCPDAVKEREIEMKIKRVTEELRSQIPETKYVIREERVIYNKSKIQSW